MLLNKNYTIVSIAEDEIVLKLMDGKKWRSNANTLPSLLTVMQVDAGEGFKEVGPLNTNKGVAVASIYQHPTVTGNKDATTGADRDPVMLYRTHSHELWIYGVG